MRLSIRTRRRAVAAGLLLCGVLAAAWTARSAPAAAQDAEDDPEAAARVAAEELAKAVTRGKELFEGRELGRKSCKECHMDPDKPQDDLRQIAWSYPAYSRRARRVVTLQQKINEMIQYKARGTPLEADGADVAALAAYVTSLRSR